MGEESRVGVKALEQLGGVRQALILEYDTAFWPMFTAPGKPLTLSELQSPYL